MQEIFRNLCSFDMIGRSVFNFIIIHDYKRDVTGCHLNTTVIE